jgi:hypothetical protein
VLSFVLGTIVSAHFSKHVLPAQTRPAAVPKMPRLSRRGVAWKSIARDSTSKRVAAVGLLLVLLGVIPNDAAVEAVAASACWEMTHEPQPCATRQGGASGRAVARRRRCLVWDEDRRQI